MDLGLYGKIAAVTASSRGLGKAVAEALAKEGVNLAICARNRGPIEETTEILHQTYKIELLPIVCDVSPQ